MTGRCTAAQRNLELLEKNIAALDAKLSHEQGKLATYGADLQAAEAKCARYETQLWHAAAITLYPYPRWQQTSRACSN
jgi:multidrug resistance efflux pump